MRGVEAAKGNREKKKTWRHVDRHAIEGFGDDLCRTNWTRRGKCAWTQSKSERKKKQEENVFWPHTSSAKRWFNNKRKSKSGSSFSCRIRRRKTRRKWRLAFISIEIVGGRATSGDDGGRHSKCKRVKINDVLCYGESWKRSSQNGTRNDEQTRIERISPMPKVDENKQTKKRSESRVSGQVQVLSVDANQQESRLFLARPVFCMFRLYSVTNTSPNVVTKESQTNETRFELPGKLWPNNWFERQTLKFQLKFLFEHNVLCANQLILHAM